jgi:hypothetical protein
LRARSPGLPLRTRLPGDPSFVFPRTATVMQRLLPVGPRYRDFPLPVFIVPLITTFARILLGDQACAGGHSRPWAGTTLADAAIAGPINDGPLNLQSLTWNAAALLQAVGTLRPVRPRVAV